MLGSMRAREPTPDKIDAPQRVLMWICTAARRDAKRNQGELAELARAHGATHLSGPGTLSRVESGERWLNDSKPLLEAYAEVAGYRSTTALWAEAIKLAQPAGVRRARHPGRRRAPEACTRLETLRAAVN